MIVLSRCCQHGTFWADDGLLFVIRQSREGRRVTTNKEDRPGIYMSVLRKIRLIEGNAKCHNLKELTGKGTLRHVSSGRQVLWYRRKIRLIESNAKCRNLKELSCKGNLRHLSSGRQVVP